LQIDIQKNYKQVATTPFVPDNKKAVFNQYTIRTDKRDELIKFLREKGIPTAIHYPMPLHMQDAFKFLGYKDGDLPISEKVSKDVMSLPMFPEMEQQEQDLVIETIRSFYEK